MEINLNNVILHKKIDKNSIQKLHSPVLKPEVIEKNALNGLEALANQNVAFCGNVNKLVNVGMELAQEKKLLPEFLYHFTTPNNYQTMKKAGKIIPNQEGNTGLNGIFTFDLPNFLNNWGKVQDRGLPLDRKLVTRIAQAGNGEIVLLKIPTEGMNPDLCKIRSQNLIFDMYNGVESLPNPYMESMQDLMIDNFNENYWHLMKASSLENAKEFVDKGHALEYILDTEIPMDSVQSIGSVNLKDFIDVPYNELVSNILKKLLGE